MPIIEVLQAPASTAFIADEDLLVNSDIIPEIEGILSLYSGLGQTDSKTLCMVVVWETHEHHVKCAADSQAMAKVLAFLGPALGGAPVIKNIDVGDQYAEVLDADFTEFSFVEVKPHAPIEQTDKLLERLVESTCGVEEYRKPVHGYTVGSPDSKSVYGVLKGWVSRETALASNAYKSDPNFLSHLERTTTTRTFDFARLKKVL